MTKTDPAPMAPPLRAEEEEEEEEDEPVPEPPSPTQERRQKPVVHPSAPAPLPKDYGNPPPHPAIWPGALGGQGGLAEISADGDGGRTPEDLKVVWRSHGPCIPTPFHSFIHSPTEEWNWDNPNI